MKAIEFFEEQTGVKFDDIPEGKQQISATLTIKLMDEFLDYKMRNFPDNF
jgi:hypothetical protein